MSQLTFRIAEKSDLPDVVAMLRDDVLGEGREGDDLSHYEKAFREIQAQQGNDVIVAEIGSEIVATCQLTILPNLSRNAAKRAQVEGVRVKSSCRGQKIGHKLIEEMISRAREQGCTLLQLTTDKKRPEAIAFYEHLGFVSSHLGMKKEI